MLECCLDESGTDRQSKTAVLGGLFLTRTNYSWLDLAWQNMLEKHRITSIHMKEFGRDGELRHLSYADRRELCSDVVRLIRDHKQYTIAGVITSDQYNRHFGKLFKKEHKMSIYGACFLIVATLQVKQAQHANYKGKIAYLLDTGNEHRGHIVNSHEYMTKNAPRYSHIGTLTFSSDAKERVLQAADVIAWSVRKRLTDGFKNGFEPLEAIFDDDHIEQPFEEAWMVELADAIRAKRDQETVQQ